MKSGNRRPPAYQEYGSDLLGLEAVRLMSLAERGIFATLRWYCWANDSIPAEPSQMARVLGLEVQDVIQALSERVLGFFAPLPNDQTRLHCPELAAQMVANLALRNVRAGAGKKGGKTTQRRRRAEAEDVQAKLEAEIKQSLKPPEMRRDRDRGRNRDETELGRGVGKPTPPKGSVDDEFVRDMEREEARAAEARTSKRSRG
jgi:uncharacterized protein YdaU (DUF1376 family)